MNKKLIFFLLVIVLIIIGFFVSYFYYEKPKSEQSNEFVNLSIGAEYEGNLIKTGYVIEYNGKKVDGETMKGYNLEKIPINQTIKAYNKNLEGQGFYTDYKEFSTSDDIYRIKFDLNNAEQVFITQQGELNDYNSNINLTLYSKYFRDVGICFLWSSKIIYIELNNSFYEYLGPSRIDYDKCYSLNVSLKDYYFVIPINYNSFGNMENDFINVTVYDTDWIGFEDSHGKDIGGKDYNFLIKSEVL